MKKLLLIFTSISLLTCHLHSYAFEWQDLWLTKDQQAQQALSQGDPVRAATLFTQTPWQAVASYRAGDYSQATQLFAQQQHADGHYNQGNALAMQGAYHQAIAAYDAALALEPEHADAAFNRELVQQLLEQTPPQQQAPQQQASQQQAATSNSQSQNNKDQTEEDNSPENNESPSDIPDNSDDSTNDLSTENSPEQPSDQSDQQDDTNTPQQTPTVRLTANQAEPQSAKQQWLRRVPDQPGNLLQQLFLREYLASLKE
jgi:Ca-activated chloride channel family protein